MTPCAQDRVMETDRKPKIRAGRVLFPLPLLWFCLIALLISLLVPLRIANTDIWYHLRNAEQMLVTHSFLRADTYTFTSAGAALLNHEWLAELPYYMGFKAFGLRGLAAVNVCILCLVFGGVYYLSCQRGADCSDAALLTSGGLLLSLYSCGPRMHNFGYLCLVVLLIALERFQKSGRGLWILPPLFAIWINLHGSWVFGFVVVGICCVSGCMQKDRGRMVADPWTPVQFREVLAVTAVSAAALLVNPYGYRLVVYPFDLILRQQANLENVIEWKSVDFHTFYGKLALGMVFVVLGTAWFSEKRWTLRDVLLVSFALWVSLTHIRFLIFAAIVLVPVVAPRVQICPSYDRDRDHSWRNLAAAAGIIALLVWLFPTSQRLQAIIDASFPRAALQYMEQNKITGNLFHAYGFGGYIEWNAPAIKTFADDRTDIFVYNGVFDDYLKAVAMQQPQEILDRYKIAYVLYSPGSPLSLSLERGARWKVIYADEVAMLFERLPEIEDVQSSPRPTAK